MKKRQKLLTAILVITLTVMMFPLAVFAADGDTAPKRNGDQAKRTIMLYDEPRTKTIVPRNCYT